MAFRSFLNCRAARRTALLVGISLLVASHAAAQGMCDDPGVSVPATAPSLDDFDLLFRQNSVSFYSHLPARDSAGPAVVLIRNGNSYPVEVSYGVALQLQSDAGTRTISLGRHCARIGAQGYASSTEEAPARTVAMRVRNLTISNLVDAPTQPLAPGAGTGDPQAVGPGTQSPAPAPARPGPVDSTPGSVERPLLEVLGDPGSESAPPSGAGSSREPAPSGSGAASPSVGTMVIDTVIRIFQLTAIVVLTVAGLALVLPVLGSIYLLLLSVLVLIGRLFRPRSR